MNTFYETFLAERRLVGENEFTETWEFEWRSAPAVVRMTKAKAAKTDEIVCEPNKVRLHRRYAPYFAQPLGGMSSDDTVLSNAAFARRGAICVFVVRGKPANIWYLDQYEWIRADYHGDAKGKIYLMSGSRFEGFDPGEKPTH